jgi:hypothetical protein
MASHVVLSLDDDGIETSAHRAELPKAYNAYSPSPDGGDAELLLRPLFITSFLLDDALGEQSRPVIVSSASSKTALGLARLQAARGTPLTGLTSARNRAFVEGLGVYDTVATYDHPPSGEGALLIDIAGSRPLKAGETLAVGATQYDRLSSDGATVFFAPSELRTRRGRRRAVPSGASTRTARVVGDAGWSSTGRRRARRPTAPWRAARPSPTRATSYASPTLRSSQVAHNSAGLGRTLRRVQLASGVANAQTQSVADRHRCGSSCSAWARRSRSAETPTRPTRSLAAARRQGQERHLLPRRRHGDAGDHGRALLPVRRRRAG